MADVLRADGRAESRRPALRGHPVGRFSARRVHRVPARVVAEPSDRRDHARAARALRSARRLGLEHAQLHVAVSRAAPRRGDRRHARRPGPGPPRGGCGRRSGTGRTASRCTRSRRCACCSTRGCSSGPATSTGPSGRSTPSTCRRPSRPSSPPGSTDSTPRSAVCSATRRCSGRRSPSAVSSHSREHPKRRSRHCSRASSARRSWRSSRTRGLPNAASTASSRRSSSGSPTKRCHATTARRSTSMRPSISQRSRASIPTRSPR